MKQKRQKKFISVYFLSGICFIASLYLLPVQAYAFAQSKEHNQREIIFSSRFYEIQHDAKKGRPHAQYLIGMMYQSGYNVEIDDEKASEWLHASALQGYPMAQNEVGMLYETGRNGVVNNVEVAYYWYKLAAIQDYAPAADNLAYMYANGRGVEKDFYEALVWYERAAQQGYVQAIQNLAWLLATVPIDGLRNGARALRLIEPIALEYSKNPGILDTLAAAFAEVGLFEEAIAMQQAAIKTLVNSETKNINRALQFAERLTRYQNDKPWRRQ